jgi:hypothetical protein
MTAALPTGIARCSPSCVCPQIRHCARANNRTGERLSFIDASVTLTARNRVCWLFIDERRPAFAEAA